MNSDCVPGVPLCQENNALIKASFVNCSGSSVDDLVELIQEDTPDCLGVVKTIKRDLLIPTNSERSVPCGVKTGYIDRTLPGFF